jgi:tetratricopeptide (TPR) repeat protein
VKQKAGRVFAAGFSILIFGAAYQESMTAWAYYLANQRTPESLDRASQFAPLNAVFWRERGILRLDTNPVAAERLLIHSTMLNACEADALIGLGLLAESGARLQEAEDYLTRAARISRRFRPKWALAFFYARQGKFDQFWPAASDAANVDAADVQPVFRLAHKISVDAETVAESLQLRNQHARASYLEFLLKQKASLALSRVALQIQPNSESRSLLGAAVDRLINETRTDEAVQLWNHLNRGRGGHQLSPATGVSLTNGAFEAGERHGFDWRYATTSQGIAVRPGAPGDLRIEFSGRESESMTIVDQFVPVVPDRTYRLSFSYGTSGLSGITGLRWEIFPATSTLSTPINAIPEGTGSLPFRTGPDVKLIRIALTYSRVPGTTRLEGSVTLHSARLELL